ARKIRVMKSEVRVPARDRALTPGNSFRMNFNAVVGPLQVLREANREIANPASNVQHSVLGSKPSADELCAGDIACTSESAGVRRAVVVEAEMRRRQETGVAPPEDPVDWRQQSIEPAAHAAGNALPTGPSPSQFPSLFLPLDSHLRDSLTRSQLE